MTTERRAGPLRGPALCVPFLPLFALALFAATLCATAVRADSTADEADFRFRRGAQLYRAGKYDEALSEFLGSNRLVRNRNVVFNIARCFEKLEYPNEAYRWYSEVLDADAPASDRAAVQASLARLKPRVALLEVVSDPPGATVYVDRRNLGARGQTPLVLALPPGKANVLLELEGHRGAQGVAHLAVGQTARVQLDLERIYGKLDVDGSPGNYVLRLDRSDAEPVTVEDGAARVLPGEHEVFISANGFLPEQQKILVPPDGVARIRFRLSPLRHPTGRVVVRANVDGALVRIDGKEMGFTPFVAESVNTGEHAVTISADGREPFQQKIKVTANERSFVDARLRYAQARVVAAQKELTLAQDAPASITVIEADEIRGFGYTTLAEALRSVRGLYTSSDRDYESLGVRGFSTPGTFNNRVLVLSDGHVTNDITVGQGFIGRDFQSDLADVERIEIVRGPGSVLYGSSAFFAVVNVVHRQPADGRHAELGGHVGTLGENQGHAQASVASSGSRWLELRVSGLDATGEEIFASPATSGPNAGFARRVDGEQAVHADLRARLAEGLSLSASLNSRTKAIPTAPSDTFFGLPGTSTRDQRGFVELGYSRTAESGLGLDARASYDAVRYIGHWQYRGSDDSLQPGNDTNTTDWLSGEVRLRLPTFAGNRTFVGGEVQDRLRVDFTSYSPDPDPAQSRDVRQGHSEWVASVYAGDDLRLSSRAQLSAALRLDDYIASDGTQSLGAVLNPRVALLLKPYEAGHSKLLVGTAFREPSIYERYYNDEGRTQIAAQNLQPERVLTLEAEHTHQLGDEVSVLGSAYWSRIENLVTVAPVAGGVFQYQNSRGLVHSAGVEGEVRWRPGRGALFALWYGFNRTRDTSGGSLANSPQHTGAVRFLYPLVNELLSLGTEVSYGSQRHTVADGQNPDQLVGEALDWNAGLSGEYARLGLRYGAHVYNLLDQRVLLPGGLEVPFPGHAVPQLGRTLRLTLAATF